MNNYKLHNFENSEALIDELCKRILVDLKSAIASKGMAYIAFSGGSTPKKLFTKLSCSEIEWKKVIITLVDERWVEQNSDNSNEKLIRTFLLKDKAKEAKFISLKNSSHSAKEGLNKCKVSLKEITKLDIVILGMGNDAHTASFFPDAKELEEAYNTDEVCLASTATIEPKERITLSKKFLLKADSIILHIEGKQKKKIFDNVLKSSDTFKMPILSMMQQKEPIMEVYYA